MSIKNIYMGGIIGIICFDDILLIFIVDFQKSYYPYKINLINKNQSLFIMNTEFLLDINFYLYLN